MRRGLWNYPEGSAVRFLCIYMALFSAFGAYHTASVTFISRHTPAHMKSTVQTVFAALTVGLGGICGGVFGGWLAEEYGFHTLYRVFGIIGFIGFGAALWGKR